MNHLCATLLVFCSSINIFFTDERNDFVQEIGTCAVEYNAYLVEPQDRIPVSLVVAIAALESGWGKSRFARKANNYFGIKTDSNHMFIVPKDNPDVKLAKYYTVCDSVNDFMDLVNEDHRYKTFKDVLHEQWLLNVIDYEVLVNTLDYYSDDPKWKKKILKIIKRLEII